MKKIIGCGIALLILSMPLFAADDARKIAKVNAEELHELALSLLLSKPENSVKKEKYAKLQDEVATTQFQIGTCTDEATRRLVEQKFTEASRKQEEFKKSLESETQRVISKAIREFSKGKFVAVLDYDANETIVFKDVELVDITFDIKEKLLVGNEAKADQLTVVSPVTTVSPSP